MKRVVLNYLVVAAFAVSATFTSCKKNDNDKVDVYVAGVRGNNATLWKNGIAKNLTDGTNYAYANSVFVSGGDVYVAGYEINGQNYIATLWKNGIAQDLYIASNTMANSVFVVE